MGSSRTEWYVKIACELRLLSVNMKNIKNTSFYKNVAVFMLKKKKKLSLSLFSKTYNK